MVQLVTSCPALITERRQVAGDGVTLLHKWLQSLMVNGTSEAPLGTSSSSRMRVIYNNWSAMKQRPHPQSVAEISRHSVLSGDRIQQCEKKKKKLSAIVITLCVWPGWS